MLLRELSELLNCQVLSCENRLDHEIEQLCASELMSNVLTCMSPNTLLITGLNNLQVIRTAEMSGVPAVIFIQGKKPGTEAINLAVENEIVIMVSEFSMFKACGVLYQAGLRCVFDE